MSTRPDSSSPPLARPSADLSLLLDGLMSAGIGVMRNVEVALRCICVGLGCLVSGRFSLAGHELGRGLLKLFVQVPLDVGWSLGGRWVSGLQTWLGLEPVGCRLGAKQIAELYKVFGDSIDYERVRLKVGRLGLLSWAGRAFVLGHTLYFPRDIPPSASGALQLPMHLLVHELGHVWQYQNGGTDYVCETLWPRWFGHGFDWREALDEGWGWRELDPDQQVRLLQVVYARSRFFEDPDARFVDEETGADYTGQLEEAIEQIWARQGAP